MANSRRHIPLRDARDRLLEALGIGNPYPLRDLIIPETRLSVPFGDPARIPIPHSQPDVDYTLYDEDNPVEGDQNHPETPGEIIRATGTGETLYLTTNAIIEEQTFQIFARKNTGINANEAYLHESVRVSVGLDASLRAYIKDAAFLDQRLAFQTETATRIIDYGAPVTVVMPQQQEGVDYRLIRDSDGAVLSNDEKGIRSEIEITSTPLFEDTTIRIAHEKGDESGLLDVVLTVAVRANRNVQLRSDTIIAYQSAARLTIAASQPGVTYHLFRYTLRDEDFVYGQPSVPVTTVPVPQYEDAQILRPVTAVVNPGEVGFQNEAGNGGYLDFTLPVLIEDTRFTVHAVKLHESDTARKIASAVRLDAAAVVLVRPNPTPDLTVTAFSDGDTIDTLVFTDGQPGVFYGVGLNEIVYIHKRQLDNPSLNKGLGRLRLDVDFVVARADQQTDSPQTTPPLPPLLGVNDLLVEDTLMVTAMKARSRVETPVGNIGFPYVPGVDIAVQARRVVVTISASQPTHQYRLYEGGQPVGAAAQPGGGAPLQLETTISSGDSQILLSIEPLEPNGIRMALFLWLDLPAEDTL